MTRPIDKSAPADEAQCALEEMLYAIYVQLEGATEIIAAYEAKHGRTTLSEQARDIYNIFERDLEAAP